MGKTVPIASFRRAARPAPSEVEAFVALGDAPGDTPVMAVPAIVERPTPPESGAAEVRAESEVATPQAQVPATATMETLRAAGEPKPGNKWRRKTVQRADGRELRKQTFYLDVELSHRLMMACAAKQYDLSEALEEAVNWWLNSRC
jgi:hypothetical protein